MQKKEMYAKCVRELSSAIRWIKPSLWLLNGKFPTNCTKNQLIQLKDLKHMTKTTNAISAIPYGLSKPGRFPATSGGV